MLLIAKVLKSNGTDGGLLIGSRQISLEDIDMKEPVFIYFDGLPVPFFIQSLEKKGTEKAVVHLNDICNLEDAEEVVGQDIWADYEIEDEDNEDFTGWTILDKGKKLGIVSGLEPIPGNLCLYVNTPSGQVLIPVHEDFIIEALEDKKILNLDLPEGLY